MHRSVKQFIKEIRKEWPQRFVFKKVLEVGSHNINGSPRRYFWFCNYTGIDISKGKGVDIVGNFNNYPHLKDYDVIVSTEMLEHDSQWESSLMNMYYALKPNGMLIITCAAPDRPEHGTKRTSPEDSPDTTDYYRNISTYDFKKALPMELFKHYVLMYARGKNDLQFFGIKKEKRTLAFGVSYDPK